MAQIIHVVIDDKFIDGAALRFESVAPGVSRYVLPGEPRPLCFIKDTPVEFLDENELRNLVAEPSCKAVIFHSLTPARSKVLAAVNPNARVVWMGWGYDYYYSLLRNYFPEGLLLPKTKAIVEQLDPSSGRFGQRILRRLRFMKEWALPSLKIDYSKVDFFCPVLEIEHQMALRENPLFRAAYYPWNYQSRISEERTCLVNDYANLGANILVGNSATGTNNHFEILDLLASCNGISGRKIITPLNYGDSAYGDAVSEKGYSLFGDQFIPLRDWMGLDDYFSLLRSCRIAIFGHLRQQAGGNVIQMMKQGSRVYLFEANPLFQSLTSRGAFLSSIDDLRHVNAAPSFEPLSVEEHDMNLQVADQHIEYAPGLHRTRGLVEILLRN